MEFSITFLAPNNSKIDIEKFSGIYPSIPSIKKQKQFVSISVVHLRLFVCPVDTVVRTTTAVIYRDKIL
jgi:hypothetical protein